MPHQGCKHFEAPTMELVPFVLKEKLESTILNCKTQLPFPHPTCHLIIKIGSQGFIGVACGEFKHAEIKLDLLQRVKKSFRVFNRVELEELSTNPKRSNMKNRRTKGCLKPEAYCLLPLGSPKYKEKKTREARLGLESKFRIIDPSPLPIPDWHFQGGFGEF
jgi:hypothetical protein